MDVYVPIFEHFVGDVEQRGVSLDVLESEHGRLFHYFAQITCKRELSAFATAEAGLYKKYLATHGCPSEACHYTCVFVAFVLKPEAVIEEVELSEPFRWKRMFSVVIRYVAPICILVILISSVLTAFGVVKI